MKTVSNAHNASATFHKNLRHSERIMDRQADRQIDRHTHTHTHTHTQTALRSHRPGVL
jgi:hypothetical protein